MKQENKKPGNPNKDLKDAGKGYDPTDRNFQRTGKDGNAITDDKNLNQNAGSSEETEDTDPPLTEHDLKENDLSIDEADRIEWDDNNPRGDK